MTNINAGFADIGLMDQLVSMNTPIHRLDPRTKLLTTLVFIITVVSFGKYEISALLPFFIYPIALIVMAELPVMFLFKRILLVAPFAVMIGILNPVLDKNPLLLIGSLSISGGWVSFASILIRFMLTVGVALILLACSGINGVCVALEKLGTPTTFTVQLLLLHRYLFVLMSEGIRMARARAIRSNKKRGMGLKAYGHLLGHLLLRAIDRAQRIHLAMISRGFNGYIKPTRHLQPGLNDVLFAAGWSGLFIAMRIYNVSQLLGALITKGLS